MHILIQHGKVPSVRWYPRLIDNDTHGSLSAGTFAWMKWNLFGEELELAG